METLRLKMAYHPPIARGIIAAFDKYIDYIRKIAIMSIMERFSSQLNEKIPSLFEEALELFSKITDDSTTDECSQFIEFLKNIPTRETEFMTHFEKETTMTDFYNYCRKMRDLVEHKLSVPLKQWKLTKQDAMNFSEVYGKLLDELEDVRHTVEKARLLRDKVMPEQAAKGEKMKKKISASEDFKSLHPFFLITNSEEHMEKISSLKQKVVQALEEQQKIAEQNFKRAPLKFRREIQSIIEETLKNKYFIEWLEERNYSKLKEYEVKMKEEWNEFTSEMEKSRNLGKTYYEKHALYLEIEREKADRERWEKQDSAARVLQVHWRAYVAKKGHEEI